MNIQREKARVAAISVASNSTLVLLKLIVGIIVGSVSVISEAIHSGMDLLAAIIAFFAVKKAGKNADADHPFGHGKVENISAFIEALLILVAAIWIIYEAVQKLINPHPLEIVGLGVAVMFVSSMVNFAVSQLLFKVGKKTDSPALIADGWHLRTDVYTSAGVMAGLGLVWVCEYVFGLKLYWLDPAVAIGVAILILRTSYRLTMHSIRDLIDTSTPAEETAWVRDYLTQLYPTLRSVHRLRTRKAGATRFIDLHLAVDSNMTVSESHRLADQISSNIKAQFPYADVILHIEPCDGSCSYACNSGCLLTEEERKSVHSPKE